MGKSSPAPNPPPPAPIPTPPAAIRQELIHEPELENYDQAYSQVGQYEPPRFDTAVYNVPEDSEAGQIYAEAQSTDIAELKRNFDDWANDQGIMGSTVYGKLWAKESAKIINSYSQQKMGLAQQFYQQDLNTAATNYNNKLNTALQSVQQRNQARIDEWRNRQSVAGWNAESQAQYNQMVNQNNQLYSQAQQNYSNQIMAQNNAAIEQSNAIVSTIGTAAGAAIGGPIGTAAGDAIADMFKGGNKPNAINENVNVAGGVGSSSPFVQTGFGAKGTAPIASIAGAKALSPTELSLTPATQQSAFTPITAGQATQAIPPSVAGAPVYNLAGQLGQAAVVPNLAQQSPITPFASTTNVADLTAKKYKPKGNIYGMLGG